ncbi:spartin-like [Penaeus chinensis]|uniref:spartin-like n=1 Tax=Penaeus chinensis TaxID=139456 RepID=UPI001FB84013|nr:spartin-like [Penaeus chinensis]
MSSETPEKNPPTRPAPPTTLMMNTEAASQEEEFVKTYREAYKYIDHGITLATQNMHTQAGSVLQKGLALIDKALTIKIENFDCSGEKIQHYAEMQNKMRCTRKEVLNHFTDGQTAMNPSAGAAAPGLEDAPPSYEDYLRSLDSGRVTGVTSVIQSIHKICSVSQVQDAAFTEIASESPIVTPVMSPQNGEMIFQIENGVQIFFIYPDGRVTSPSYPSFLAVFTFPEPIGHNAGPNGARGFLQVGEWSYPLIPARSPVLHSFYGAYMFPDVTNNVPGSSVGVIIPDTVEKETLEFFEQILMQLTSYQEQKTPEGIDAEKETELIHQSTSERIASGLVAGAEAISKGVVWGASKLSELITIGSENLKEYVQPEENKKEIDPKWQTTAKVARDVSGKAVKVSGFLLSQVGKATMALGRRVAPHIQKHGTRAISHLTGQKEKEASSNVEGVLEVAAGAVKGASTVYMSLENAAATLATSITQNTVKVVTHKYGEEAGDLTGNTLYAVGQTALVGHNIASLGVKGIAKRTAKDTGKALVHQHEEKKQSKLAGGVEEVEEAMEVTEEEGNNPPPKPIREKKKKPL